MPVGFRLLARTTSLKVKEIEARDVPSVANEKANDCSSGLVVSGVTAEATRGLDGSTTSLALLLMSLMKSPREAMNVSAVVRPILSSFLISSSSGVEIETTIRRPSGLSVYELEENLSFEAANAAEYEGRLCR
jgi:hypothetical protein